MEFGFCDHGKFVYMADANTGTSEEFLAFRDRATEWAARHEAILGEITADLRPDTVIQERGGVGYYDMRAVITKGPQNLLERVS